MREEFQIALLPGDGIGPEVVAEAVRVLRACESVSGAFHLEFTDTGVGAGEYLRNGDPLPASAFELCRRSDAILLGAMGLPDVRWPDGREMTPQLDLRERLQLYAGLRPIHLYSAGDCPLKGYGAGAIDFLLVRESTEGLFSARLSRMDPSGREAQDVLRLTRAGCERVLRAAFEQARRRRGHLTLVDKANVLPSMVFFRRIFEELAPSYPDVRTDAVYVDAAALYLVRRPESFDVLVTENMFGDILSDLAAGLVGGMGMAPSADVGEDCAVFQPAHGSAPDIAGQGKANPVATILSAAMMLDWLDTDGTREGARRIRQAVKQTLGEQVNRTPDLGGSLQTADLGRLIAEAVLECRGETRLP